MTYAVFICLREDIRLVDLIIPKKRIKFTLLPSGGSHLILESWADQIAGLVHDPLGQPRPSDDWHSNLTFSTSLLRFWQYFYMYNTVVAQRAWGMRYQTVGTEDDPACPQVHFTIMSPKCQTATETIRNRQSSASLSALSKICSADHFSPHIC